MTDDNDPAVAGAAQDFVEPDERSCGDSLRTRLERLRALRAAWGALAPSGLATAGRDISDRGRDVSQLLRELAARGSSEADLEDLDGRLTELEDTIRAIAKAVPVAQLRATLPARVGTDRRAILELLDLLLGSCDGSDTSNPPANLADGIGAIDYLITLLCTEGAARNCAIRHDPVSLTQRLASWCKHAEADHDPRLQAVEAEFFEASGMAVRELENELKLRTLRRRKAELGLAFFAPRILRAIVTYNATLLQKIAHEVWDSQDWGDASSEDSLAPPSEALDEVAGSGSVFESPALQGLSEALRRRHADELPGEGPIDRVAWGLDLGYPTKSERAAILAPSAGLPENPAAAAILVGLLCRSRVALAEALPSIGLSPERLCADWVQELDACLKREVDEHIAEGRYREGCALSELRTKFLYAPLADAHADELVREGLRANKPEAEDAKDGASERSRKAPGTRPGRRASRKAGPGATKAQPSASAKRRSPGRTWTDVARIGAVGLALLVLGVQLIRVTLPGELASLGSSELQEISRYLVEGKRSGHGEGAAFAGSVDDRWLQLDPAERQEAAIDLVVALRTRGVREIMVFDAERRVRVQALGDGAVRIP